MMDSHTCHVILSIYSYPSYYVMKSDEKLPKPTEKTRVAIVSEASTATLVFEVGLSVAGKGGSSLESIFGVFSLALWRYWIIFRHFGHFFGVSRYSLAIMSNCQ